MLPGAFIWLYSVINSFAEDSTMVAYDLTTVLDFNDQNLTEATSQRPYKSVNATLIILGPSAPSTRRYQDSNEVNRQGITAVITDRKPDTVNKPSGKFLKYLLPCILYLED